MVYQCVYSYFLINDKNFKLTEKYKDVTCSDDKIQYNLLLFYTYFGCGVIDEESNFVLEYKTVDLFKLRYGVPMLLVYTGIPIALILLCCAGCFLKCLCCCC